MRFEPTRRSVMNASEHKRVRPKKFEEPNSAPRIEVYYLASANYFLRDFSPGASVTSASRPPFIPTQEFLVSG